MSIAGLDIGGTRFRAVLTTRDGAVLGRSDGPTLAERGPADSLGRMIAVVRDMAARTGTEVEAVGIGVTGPVDPITGVVDNPYTLGGWPPTDLRAPFAEAFGGPVAVDNDANVAAVGEWWAGAGRGFRRVAMVTIGTGIGVATLVEGRIQRAVDGRHGEAGHMVIDPSGPECYCGAHGCWEVLASGTALTAAARSRAFDPGGLLHRTTGGDREKVTGRMLFEAAAAGDDAARRLTAEAARHIGLGLVNLAATVMPDVFVLAGGVSENLPAMRADIEAVLRRHAVMVPTDVPLVRAELGDDAGPIGAARIALDLLGEFWSPP